MAAPPGQANKRTAVDIHPIDLQQLKQIRLPAAVDSSVFRSALHVAKAFNQYEGKPTGCQLILGRPSMQEIAKSMDDPEEGQSSLLRKLIKDSRIEGRLREEFARDGGILIDGHSGEILATRSTFSTGKSDFVLARHGTRHNYSLDVAASRKCAVIVRSQDGPGTVFSSEYLQKEECTPRCFRLNVEDEPGQEEILMPRTPLVRFKRDSTGAEKLLVPEEAADLKTLPSPIRVAGFVGLGRTGKSTLAGAVACTKSLFPAVTEGIDAAAIKHPDGGSLILLDCEGFANLGSLVCGLIVSVVDSLDDSQLTSLAQLGVCREVLLGYANGSDLMPPPPDLLVVVNGSRFHDLYTDRTLEEALAHTESGETETGRHQTRAAIHEHFPRRKFLSVPCLAEADYRLRCEVQKCSHLTCNQQPCDGRMFLNLVHRAVAGINAAEPLHPGSVYDLVLREHFGRLMEQALTEFKCKLPEDGPYQRDLVFQPEKLLEQIPEQCRKDAKARLRDYFDVVKLKNEIKGEQIQKRECEEHVIEEPPTFHEVTGCKNRGTPTENQKPCSDRETERVMSPWQLENPFQDVCIRPVVSASPFPGESPDKRGEELENSFQESAQVRTTQVAPSEVQRRFAWGDGPSPRMLTGSTTSSTPRRQDSEASFKMSSPEWRLPEWCGAFDPDFVSDWWIGDETCESFGPESSNGPRGQTSRKDFPGACTISTGGQHLCALQQASGRVVCWGAGDFGQLGDNRATSSDRPVPVRGLGPAIADGQLGFGGRSRRADARPVASLGPALDIRAGGSHTCALEASGTVRCWGWGEFGQLGNGRTLDSLYPVRENAIAICSGALHSCAVEYTGFVKCWGWGERGQLGRPSNGTSQTANSPVPVQVEGVEDAIAVVCGYQHSCAMSANETTLCWGDGIDRQLQRHDEIWAKTGRRVMRLNEILELSAPMPTAPMKSVWSSSAAQDSELLLNLVKDRVKDAKLLVAVLKAANLSIFQRTVAQNESRWWRVAPDVV
eukprot:s54_g15.t1